MIHVLFLSLIATLGAVTTCSESSADLDSQNCGASWLQERYQLHSGNATLAGARHVDWEPHVSGSELAILAVLVFLVFILMHECWVGRGKDPILSTEPIREITACSVYLFVVELSFLIVVPLSMDYALAMGELVAASGAVLGVTLPAQYVGYLIGVWMDKQSDWFRIKCVVCHVVALLCYLGLTLLLRSAARSGHALRQTFWIAICVQVAATTFRNIPSRTWEVIQDYRESDAYNLSKCCGSMCGPILFAFMVYQMHSLSPVGMMACIFGVLLVGQAILTALTALTFAPYSRRASMIDAMMTEESRKEASEERLPKSDEATKRERLVWNLIIYWYEHNLSFFASEFGMITILEITYEWSVGACALAMSAKQVARFLIIRMLGKIEETTSFTERNLFSASACVAMCFSLLLFQWHWTGSSGAISLLVADSMIYCFTCATCIPARTWCVQSYIGRPDLQWLQAEHRWQAGHTDAVCALLVSILIRFLVDKGGRNYFAIFQLVVRFLGFCTACKAVSLKQEVDKEVLHPRTSASHPHISEEESAAIVAEQKADR
ncbi:hypothetical protein AK812_SmicGene37708 [Symbiodinium microadriaticum]|uniref:Major facilitator superfamily associated domain-containing protein n=1 Tax=Symbiodinium microadriaticum TaxID=2951 RepID=A0A1Q9CFT7_SYMMI|nr:hypothetical protein AK812_SmicGene37708 [Symbiodinium microadriaticum]CAE7950012.1 unnamed protein product [Symbiodinium sp. KB8]